MKINILKFVPLLCYALSVPSLHAAGAADDGDANLLNKEWALCITEFDLSSLPPERRISGEVIVRSLLAHLGSINYRLRLSPEYAYYEGYAWQQAVSAAAKALANKRNERSLVLYRGEASWRYRSNIKKIDDDIAKLEAALAEKEAEKPLVDHEPEFVLSRANLNSTYPAPPKKGGERRFCRDQNADAILTGNVREFHGRYYVQIQLFVLYTDSWVYEDDIIFSLEDTDEAVDEIAARLTATLSGSRPASVAVTADPPDTQILINQRYAGRGAVEARERPPGNIIITAAAEGFAPEIVETNLAPGESIDVSITLTPYVYSAANIDVRDGAASVYHGALYVGEAPFHLPLPVDQLNYVWVRQPNGDMAKAAFVSPGMPGEEFNLPLKTKTYPASGEKRVDRARRRHYWAWGFTWITGIAAWTTYGIYQSQSAYSDEFQNGTMYYVFLGAAAATGAVAVYELVQMVRYIHTATVNVTPIVKREKHRK